MPGPSNTSQGSVAFSFVVQFTGGGGGNVGANTTSERTFTVPGVLLGYDVLTLNKPTHQTGLGIVNVRVSANDTVAITYMNNTGAGITPTSETYLLQIDRHGYPSQAQVPTAIS